MHPAALVIENDAGTRRLLDVVLRRLGVEADEVATGGDALLLLERVEYDLVFLDLILQDIGGAELLAWMEQARPEMLARTIVISSAPQPQINEVRQRWPHVRVIRKPFELLNVLEEAQRTILRATPRTGSIEEEFVRRSVRAGAKAGLVALANGGQFQPYMSFGSTAVLAAPEYPLTVPVWEKNESGARATVPLVRGGVTIGAASWSFREPRLFGETEQQLFLGIAAMIAAAVRLPGQPEARPSATVVRP